MGLEDYSTQELRAEIARRSSVKYKYAQGVVTEILNSDSAFCCWKWRIRLTYDDRIKFNISPGVVDVELVNGVFNKTTCPKIGDIVKIRCRITKASPIFKVKNSKICDICGI